MGAIWENKIYLVLSIIIIASITTGFYELLIYIKASNAITVFELNLIKINNL